MQFRTKRVLTFATVASYLFLTGLENAIILPTAWRYLIFLGANQEYLLGVTVSGQVEIRIAICTFIFCSDI